MIAFFIWHAQCKSLLTHTTRSGVFAKLRRSISHPGEGTTPEMLFVDLTESIKPDHRKSVTCVKTVLEDIKVTGGYLQVLLFTQVPLRPSTMNQSLYHNGSCKRSQNTKHETIYKTRQSKQSIVLSKDRHDHDKIAKKETINIKIGDVA